MVGPWDHAVTTTHTELKAHLVETATPLVEGQRFILKAAALRPSAEVADLRKAGHGEPSP